MDKKERKSVERFLNFLKDEIGLKFIKLFIEKLEKWNGNEFIVE